jgi:hypothetical protein
VERCFHRAFEENGLSTVVAILVSVALTAALTLLALPLVRRRDTLLYETRQALQARARHYRFIFFGYVIETVRHAVRIENLDGDAEVIRDFEKLRPNVGLLVGQIQGELLGSGVLDGNPSLRSVQTQERYQFDGSGAGTGVATFALQLDPPLRHDAPPVSFSVQMRFLQLHKMTRSGVKDAYRNDVFRREYSGVEINTPIHRLELEVVFPAGFEADVTAEVFYAGSEEIAGRESARVRPLLRYANSKAELVVDEPALTYVYAIAWMPAR